MSFFSKLCTLVAAALTYRCRRRSSNIFVSIDNIAFTTPSLNVAELSNESLQYTAIPATVEVRLTPEYPLTLHLSEPPRETIKTGAILSIADPMNPNAFFLGTILGVRAFEGFYVEFVLEYGGEGGRRRDNLLVPIEWAELTPEEVQYKLAAPPGAHKRYHPLPDEDQCIFIPGVRVWDMQAVATGTPHYF
ncbi:hypothetical protein BDY19DRAFT_996928 [Irpex rosettiformis]|uniref:Uncharacterized protein n=1 Tax=Irpex rosettiformis TaxID=378272 RepID=A0ACB8TT62_9APHY|nr:hypothetical protein BDY19DRAFT_996928 [Irpex rosettiformis]